MHQPLFIIRIDARGDTYRRHFAQYWSVARLLQESREGLECLAFNIASAAPDHPVNWRDREQVQARIRACLALAPAIRNACRANPVMSPMLLIHLEQASQLVENNEAAPFRKAA